MNKESKQLLEIINQSKNILLTSHKNPDHDAIGSVLGFSHILNQNFKKNIFVNFEDPVQERYSFLKGFDTVQNRKHIDIVNEENIDLIIVLDGNNWGRFIKENDEELRQYVKKNTSIKTVCIDHHQKHGYDNFDLYIHRDYGSAAEIVYDLLIEELGFSLDKEFAYCIMTGILGDTGRFMYAKDLNKTFDIAKELIVFDENMIEMITDKLSRYSFHTLKFLQELINNTVLRDGYNFSYLSDDTVEKVRKDPTLRHYYKNASEEYVNIYVRNIEDNLWGFSICPVPEEPGKYKVSFRATAGTVDTSVFARKFGGGGHVGASGCEFEADSIDDAIQILEDTIAKHLEEATL